MAAEGYSAEGQCNIVTYNYGLGPWMTPNVCDWYGVACEDGHVVALCLVNNNMNGTLVDLALPRLLKLTIVGSPLLTGTMPASYATALPLLKEMYLCII